MKFISIITAHTKDFLQEIVKGLDIESIERQKVIYQKFEHIEHTLENGCVGMFAIIDDITLEKLLAEYNNCNIIFEITDITKDVLFGLNPNTCDIDKQGTLLFMTRRFVRENITLDIVLDKIKEKGVESLTLTDKKILESI